MNRVLHRCALFGGMLLGFACGTGQPTAPSPFPAQSTITQPPPQPPLGHPPGEPAISYLFSGPLDYPIRGFTIGSQFQLYDDEVFGLRYEAFPHVYLGTYRRDNATILFRFDATWTWDQGRSCLNDSSSTRGLCPFATGTMKGELLEIRYGDSMQH